MLLYANSTWVGGGNLAEVALQVLSDRLITLPLPEGKTQLISDGIRQGPYVLPSRSLTCSQTKSPTSDKNMNPKTP